MPKLEEIASALQAGQLATSAELVPLLTSGDFHTRQEAQRLFSLCCNHSQVAYFADAVVAADSPEEVSRILLRLGDTLSPAALPVILATVEECADATIDAFGALAIGTLFSRNNLDEFNIRDPGVMGRLATSVRGLEKTGNYYYRGAPFFVGDVTKELMTAAAVAFREARGIVLVRQAALLSAASGLPCPVQSGQRVTNAELGELQKYVKSLAGMSWLRGRKYYFRHPVA